MKTYPQKITFCEMREFDVRDVLIYCRDHRCSHDVETTADVLGRSCAAVGYRAEKKPPLKLVSDGHCRCGLTLAYTCRSDDCSPETFRP